MNAMIYIRGNEVTSTAGPGRAQRGGRIEKCCPTSSRQRATSEATPPIMGISGPLSVQDSRSMHPLVDHLIEAAVQAGHRPNNDFNGAEQLEVRRFQLTRRNGVRCSAAAAYLNPSLDPPNLRVLTDTLVLRVLFRGVRAGYVGTRASRRWRGARSSMDPVRPLPRWPAPWRSCGEDEVCGDRREHAGCGETGVGGSCAIRHVLGRTETPISGT